MSRPSSNLRLSNYKSSAQSVKQPQIKIKYGNYVSFILQNYTVFFVITFTDCYYVYWFTFVLYLWAFRVLQLLRRSYSSTGLMKACLDFTNSLCFVTVKLKYINEIFFLLESNCPNIYLLHVLIFNHATQRKLVS